MFLKTRKPTVTCTQSIIVSTQAQYFTQQVLDLHSLIRLSVLKPGLIVCLTIVHIVLVDDNALVTFQKGQAGERCIKF